MLFLLCVFAIECCSVTHYGRRKRLFVLNWFHLVDSCPLFTSFLFTFFKKKMIFILFFFLFLKWGGILSTQVLGLKSKAKEEKYGERSSSLVRRARSPSPLLPQCTCVVVGLKK